MEKLVDSGDLKSPAAKHIGSSPIIGIRNKSRFVLISFNRVFMNLIAPIWWQTPWIRGWKRFIITQGMYIHNTRDEWYILTVPLK